MNYPRKTGTLLLPGIYSVPHWWHLLPLTRPSVKAPMEPHSMANNIFMKSQQRDMCLGSKTAGLCLATTKPPILPPRPSSPPRRAGRAERGCDCPNPLCEINHCLELGVSKTVSWHLSSSFFSVGAPMWFPYVVLATKAMEEEIFFFTAGTLWGNFNLDKPTGNMG